MKPLCALALAAERGLVVCLVIKDLVGRVLEELFDGSEGFDRQVDLRDVPGTDGCFLDPGRTGFALGAGSRSGETFRLLKFRRRSEIVRIPGLD